METRYVHLVSSLLRRCGIRTESILVDSVNIDSVPVGVRPLIRVSGANHPSAARTAGGHVRESADNKGRTSTCSISIEAGTYSTSSTSGTCRGRYLPTYLDKICLLRVPPVTQPRPLPSPHLAPVLFFTQYNLPRRSHT